MKNELREAWRVVMDDYRDRRFWTKVGLPCLGLALLMGAVNYLASRAS